MSTSDLLIRLRENLGLSRPELSKLLGFKSTAYVWLLEKNLRHPSIATCKKIIKVARHNLFEEWTMDMLLDD